MLRQLGHRKGVRLHSRIVDVDLKNNARSRRARFDLGRELLCTAQHDPAVDRLPTGSIAPPEFPHFLSIPAVGFYQAPALPDAPFLDGNAPFKRRSVPVYVRSV